MVAAGPRRDNDAGEDEDVAEPSVPQARIESRERRESRVESRDSVLEDEVDSAAVPINLKINYHSTSSPIKETAQ